MYNSEGTRTLLVEQSKQHAILVTPNSFNGHIPGVQKQLGGETEIQT
jgi:hypothetical protein